MTITEQKYVREDRLIFVLNDFEYIISYERYVRPCPLKLKIGSVFAFKPYFATNKQCSHCGPHFGITLLPTDQCGCNILDNKVLEYPRNIAAGPHIFAACGSEDPLQRKPRVVVTGMQGSK